MLAEWERRTQPGSISPTGGTQPPVQPGPGVMSSDAGAVTSYPDSVKINKNNVVIYDQNGEKMITAARPDAEAWLANHFPGKPLDSLKSA